MPWEEDEIYALRVAVERGENLRDFATGIARSIGSVRWKCRYLGLVHPDRPNCYTEAEDRRIIEGWKRREKPQDVADDLGRPIRSVYCRAFKLGVTGHGRGRYHGPKVRRFEVEYIRARVAQDWTAKEIAAKLKRSHHMVYRIASKHGITWARRSGPRKGEAA